MEKAPSEFEGARANQKSYLQNFVMLKPSLSDEIKCAYMEIDGAKKSKSGSEQTKATAEGDLEVTSAVLQEDLDTLGSLRHDCMTKAEEFETETKSRGEELKALATAKKIVIEATSLAQTSFVQVARTQSRSDLVTFEAARLSRDQKQRSTILSQLPSRISFSATGAST